MMALMPMSKQVWGATVTGTNIYISGTADKKDYILQDNSGLTSGYVGDSDKVLLMTNSNTLPYSKRSFVEVQSGGVNIGSNQELNLYYGCLLGFVLTGKWPNNHRGLGTHVCWNE